MLISFVPGAQRGVDCHCNTNSPHACSGAPLVHGRTVAVQSKCAMLRSDVYWCACACHDAHWTKPQNITLKAWCAAIHDETYAGDPGALPLGYTDQDAHYTISGGDEPEYDNSEEVRSMQALDAQLSREALDRVQDMRAGYLGRSAYHHHTEQTTPERTGLDVSSVMLAYLMG
jgi:hypothetical protein